MQKVQKKQHKKQKKWLLPAVVLAAAVFCAGAACCIQRFSRKTITLEDTSTAAVLHSGEENRLVSVCIFPRTGEPYTLLYKNETLVLEGDEDYSLRPYFVQSVLSYATQLEAESTVADTIENPADYGLETPSVSAAFTYQNGETLTLRIGDLTLSETPQYYASVDGDSRLYTVLEDVYDTVNTPFTSLHPVTNPSIQSDLVDRISLSGDITFTANYHKSGWHLEAPYAYPLDGDKMDSLLESLESIRFSTWVGNAEALNLADYGLDDPRITLTMVFAASVLTVPDEEGAEHTYDIPESKITIAFGNRITDMTFYVLCDDEVMTGTTLTFSFLENFNLDGMLQQNPVSFSSNDLSRVVYDCGNTHAEYEVHLVERVKANNAFETDEYGTILYDVVPYQNGKKVDSTDFLRWYQALSKVSPAGQLPDDWTPGAAAYASVTITNEDETITRTITFYPYTASYHAVAIDGTALYYVRATWPETLGDLPTP